MPCIAPQTIRVDKFPNVSPACERFHWLHGRRGADSGHFRRSSANMASLASSLRSISAVRSLIFPLFIIPHFMIHRDTPRRILSTVSEPQPEPKVEESSKFTQFARIDQGFLAWHFNLVDARKEVIASVDRAFRGFGREVRFVSGPFAGVG